MTQRVAGAGTPRDRRRPRGPAEPSKVCGRLGHHPAGPQPHRDGELVPPLHGLPQVHHLGRPGRHHDAGEPGGHAHAGVQHHLHVDAGVAREGVEQRQADPGVAGGAERREVPGARRERGAGVLVAVLFRHQGVGHRDGGHRRLHHDRQGRVPQDGGDVDGERSPGGDHHLDRPDLGLRAEPGDPDRDRVLGDVGDDHRVPRWLGRGRRGRSAVPGGGERVAAGRGRNRRRGRARPAPARTGPPTR